MADEYIKKDWAGGAPATTLNGAINAAVTSITIQSGTGQPSGGAAGKFVMVIDRGLATEEKVLVTSRTGTTLNTVQRGYDGTSAQSHSNGATIEHCIDAYTIEQVNAMANAATAQYDFVYRGSAGNTWSRVPIGSDGQVMMVQSGAPVWTTMTSAALADNAVATAKIQDNAVTKAKMADDSVGTAEIEDNAITHALMATTNRPIQMQSGLPVSPITNEMAWDTYESRLWHYNGSAWRHIVGNAIGVRARMAAAQSVNNVTNTVMSFDAEDYDTDAMHSTSTNPSRLTCNSQYPGLYHVGYYLAFAAGTGVCAAWFTLNGGSTRFAYWQGMNSAANGPIANASDFIQMAAGDYVELNVYQNSGGAINVGGSGSSASFHAWRIGMRV